MHAVLHCKNNKHKKRIKFSSLSAPTKIEELTAGSGEKTQRSPAGAGSRCGFVAQWLERATRIRKILGSIPGGAALCFFVWSELSVFLSLSELKEKRIWWGISRQERVYDKKRDGNFYKKQPVFLKSGHFKRNLDSRYRDGACAHYVMVSTLQWKPFWLATQRDPQNDWTATHRVNYDVFAQAQLGFLSSFLRLFIKIFVARCIPHR